LLDISLINDDLENSDVNSYVYLSTYNTKTGNVLISFREKAITVREYINYFKLL